MIKIKFFYILLISSIILYSCGGYNSNGVSDEGSITFKLELQDTQGPTYKPQTVSSDPFRMAAIDCTAIGISTVDATVYDSSGTTLASGSWNCSVHTGTINNISAGSNRRVVINGKDSGGSIKYIGEQTGIAITANSRTDVGTITITATTTGGTTTTTTTTTGSVTDIDGNVYNTVTIGTQVWMKENLKVTKYRNGDAIGTTTSDISSETSPKYQWAYNGDEGNVATYGRLYTWYAATDSRGLCPTGWHLPTDTEWTTLTDYLGGGSVAGGKMKEAGTTHWSSPNTSADNSSGFTALPGGYRYYFGPFGNIGSYGYWWSATEYNTTSAWYRGLYYGTSDAHRDYYYKDNGFSVRCVRD